MGGAEAVAGLSVEKLILVSRVVSLRCPPMYDGSSSGRLSSLPGKFLISSYVLTAFRFRLPSASLRQGVPAFVLVVVEMVNDYFKSDYVIWPN